MTKTKRNAYMKNVSECPVCDSKNIEIIHKVKKIFVPMADFANLDGI